MIVAPSSRSSGTRLDNPAASGAETRSSISRSQRLIQDFQRAQRGRGGVDDMQTRVQCRAEQAARIDHVVGRIDGEIQRQDMDRFPAIDLRPAAALVQHAANIVLRHRAAADRPLHVEQARFRLTAGQIDGDGAQPGVGHVLGLPDAGADRFLGGLQIGDVAAVQTPALLPAKTEDPQRAVAFHPADQAGDLGGADIDDAERAGTMMPRRFDLRRTGLGGRKHATRIVGHPFVLLRGFFRDHGNRGRG